MIGMSAALFWGAERSLEVVCLYGANGRTVVKQKDRLAVWSRHTFSRTQSASPRGAIFFLPSAASRDTRNDCLGIRSDFRGDPKARTLSDRPTPSQLAGRIMAKGAKLKREQRQIGMW